MSAGSSAGPSTSTTNHDKPLFDSIEDTVADIKAGKFVIVLDDENRENEGDLIVSAHAITTKQMAWFIKHTSGFICISLHPSIIEELEIPMMVPVNTEKNKTAYTVTVDYRHNTTTGITAHDRALSSRMLAQTYSKRGSVKPQDFCRPGHLCPLRYTEGGVRRRGGHTEAGVDLCIAAGLPPAALLCELVDPNDENGGIASRDACLAFAKEYNLKVTTIEMLKLWREKREGPLDMNGIAESILDRERGVNLTAQKVVGPTSNSN